MNMQNHGGIISTEERKVLTCTSELSGNPISSHLGNKQEEWLKDIAGFV
jgi:hypothetical protein